MSKLSLSRPRVQAQPPQPQGPLTSTQIPVESAVDAVRPTEALSREELYFQRQLEAALKKSKAEFEKVSATDETCAEKVSQSGSEGEVCVKKTRAKPKTLDTSDDEVEEIDCAENGDDEDFRPSTRVKGPANVAPRAPSSSKSRESAKCGKTKTNASPLKTFRTRTVSKPSKYKLSDSEDDKSEESSNSESDEESSEDEVLSKSKKRIRQPAKKVSGPPPKKPQTKTTPKQSENTVNENKVEGEKTNPKTEPIKITLKIPKPAEAKPLPAVQTKDKNENAAPMKKASTAPPKPASRSSISSSLVLTPKITTVSQPLTTTRPNRSLIPKWNPPAMVKNSGNTSSSSLTPSPVIGLRVGLSRNFKPATPLHKTFKNIE